MAKSTFDQENLDPEYFDSERYEHHVPVFSAGEVEGLTEAPQTFGWLAWKRFRHHRMAIIGAIGLVVILLLFIAGPMLSPWEFDERNIADRLQGPSSDHWFGTDEIGRDLFVRTAQGGLYSLRIGFIAAILATAVGTLLGALAAYFAKGTDIFISQVINMVLIVPALIVLSIFSKYSGAMRPAWRSCCRCCCGHESPESYAAWCCRSRNRSTSSRHVPRGRRTCASSSATCCPTSWARWWSR